VIPPLGGVYTGFVNGIWKNIPSFIIMVHWHIPHISYRFEVIRNFILAGNFFFRPILGCFLGKTSPNFITTHFSSQKGLSCTRPRLLSYCARKLVHGYSRALLKYNTKKNKVTGPLYVAPTWRLDRSSDPTKFGRAGNLLNVITHAKCEINWCKIVTLAKGWSFMF